MKKVTAITLAAIMAISFTAGLWAGTDTERPLGHVRGDTNVTIFDALEILKYIVGMNCEIKENGVINQSAMKAALIVNPNALEPTIFDVLEILKHLVGMDNIIDGTFNPQRTTDSATITTTAPEITEPLPVTTTSPDTTTVLTVSGMSCAACATKVKNAVTALAGVVDVTVALNTGRVTVVHNRSLNVDVIKNAIIAAGYQVE
ncbi:MAG: heavy-metal-associated domain-containing protein [Oscillospiraceae bacterium]|nr:heavy-metal-associated domain-containing protein [Oscillospiraceae bacterium]